MQPPAATVWKRPVGRASDIGVQAPVKSLSQHARSNAECFLRSRSTLTDAAHVNPDVPRLSVPPADLANRHVEKESQVRRIEAGDVTGPQGHGWHRRRRDAGRGRRTSCEQGDAGAHQPKRSSANAGAAPKQYQCAGSFPSIAQNCRSRSSIRCRSASAFPSCCRCSRTISSDSGWPARCASKNWPRLSEVL